MSLSLKKGADLFVQALENEGVTHLFALPGEENLDLIESLRESKKIELVILRHEQSAGFMAATHGRIKNKVGVCLTTLGPGATNIMTAIAYAQLGAMPMIVITGEKAIKERTQGLFQIVDTVRMMEPITKKSLSILSADAIPHTLRDAFALAQAPRSGVVHLQLPEDIAAEKTSQIALQPPHLNTLHTTPSSCEVALPYLSKAKRPLAILGMGAKTAGLQAPLTHFIEKSGLPFMTTQMGKGAISEKLPQYLGTTATSQGEKVHEFIAQADCLWLIGHDPIEKPPFLKVAPQATLIHMGETGSATTLTYQPDVVLSGPLTPMVETLCKTILSQSIYKNWHFPSAWRTVQIAPTSQAKDAPLPIRQVVKTIGENFPPEGTLTLDNGLYKLAFAQGYQATHPQALLLDNALATMGAGLPTAMAVKLLHPQRKVAAICGDGGFMMNSQELASALKMGLDLVVMILRDDAYGMIRWKQQHFGFQDFAMTLDNPNFVTYAQAYGAQGSRATDLTALQQQLQKGLHTPGVHLIDVPISYAEM